MYLYKWVKYVCVYARAYVRDIIVGTETSKKTLVPENYYFGLEL